LIFFVFSLPNRCKQWRVLLWSVAS